MKDWKEFFENYEYSNEDLPELEELIPESKIFEEFEKFGYNANAYDVVYDNNDLTIRVVPVSYEMDGGFSKNFCNHMQKICDSIGADDFRFTSTFQVIFSFDETIYNIKKYNV